MVALAYTVCALVWGTTWFAIRVCIAPGGYSPLVAAALRFSLAALVIGAAYAAGFARPGPRGRRDLGWMAAAGVANAGSYGLLYLAEQYISGGLAATLFALFPLAVALVAATSRTEHVTRTALVGSLVGLIGVGIIFSDRLAVSSDQAGAVGMVVISVLLSAVYSVIFKRVAGRQHPVAAIGVFTAMTGAVLWVGALATGAARVPWPPPAGPSLAVVYLAIPGTVLVFGCYMYLLRHISLMAVSTLVFTEPVLALAVDAVFERGVSLDADTYVGAVVVFAGVALNVFGPRLLRGRAPAKPEASEPRPASLSS